MTELADIFCEFLNIVAASTPSDLRYWIGRRGSLGLQWQLIGFLATIVLIVLKHQEMRPAPMLIAGLLSLLALGTFLLVGFTCDKVDARPVCMLLNGLQFLVAVSLYIHSRLETPSRV